jgi:hypothetical protein
MHNGIVDGQDVPSPISIVPVAPRLGISRIGAGGTDLAPRRQRPAAPEQSLRWRSDPTDGPGKRRAKMRRLPWLVHGGIAASRRGFFSPGNIPQSVATTPGLRTTGGFCEQKRGYRREARLMETWRRAFA